VQGLGGFDGVTGRGGDRVSYAGRGSQPGIPDIYTVLAAANGQLGRAAAGRAAFDQLLQRMPGLTASDPRLDRPFARATDRERFLEALRKAGVPA
jgi:hypothetical protein